jgi:hypothetical protein
MAIFSTARICGIGLIALGCTRLAFADITIEQQVAIDGFGPMKFGAMEGKTVTAISKDAARTEQQTQLKSKFLRALAKGASGNTVQIIRLDLERIDDIDVANKQYTEMSFEEMRDKLNSALNAAQGADAGKTQAQQSPSGAPVDESQCVWSPAKANIDQTGEHATIAGADTARATITVTQTCTDKTKGTSCDFVFQLDEWMASDVPGSAETREFWRAYAKKMHLEGDLTANMQSSARSVINRYQNGWGEAMKQAGRLKGYPLRTVLAMQFGGPQCNSSDGGNAGSSQTSSPPPTNSSGVVAGLTMGLFKKMHKPDESKPEDAPPPGMTQLFRMSTETVAVRNDAIPSASFEVPAGFRKVDRPAGSR